MALQVFLEFCRFTPIGKCDGRLQSPWTMLRRVRDLPGIVPAQSVFQIISQTDIMPRWINIAYQNINVREFCHG